MVTNPGEIARLRISDADRDRAASILNQAMAEGRLTPDEHSQRLDGIYAAKTQADILPFVSDLPAAAPAVTAGPASRKTPARLISVFSSTERRGRWRAPEAIGAVSLGSILFATIALFGGGHGLDRKARSDPSCCAPNCPKYG